jgi:hypothetical protein
VPYLILTGYGKPSLLSDAQVQHEQRPGAFLSSDFAPTVHLNLIRLMLIIELLSPARLLSSHSFSPFPVALEKCCVCDHEEKGTNTQEMTRSMWPLFSTLEDAATA